jgi:uncharacterized delta-60 repeat protein
MKGLLKTTLRRACWCAAALAGGVAASGQVSVLDPSFGGAGADGVVHAVLLQPDGRVVIAGEFFNVNDTGRPRVARLNADGSLDASFDPGSGLNGPVYSAALTPDGRVLVAGDFTSVNGTNRARVARLLANGALDPSFSPGSGPNGPVNRVLLQPDGRVLIAGAFTAVNGTNRAYVARLLPDGALDPGFNAAIAGFGDVQDLALQPDGRIFLCGSFTNVGGFPKIYLARVGTNGTVDLGLNAIEPNGFINRLALAPDGKLLVFGTFTAINGTNRFGVARLNLDGSLDASFVPGAPNLGSGFPAVFAAAVQSNGQVVIAGDFDAIGLTNRLRLARYLTNGLLDPIYGSPASGPNAAIYAFATQPDGRIVAGGPFFSVEGQSRGGVARLNPAPGEFQFATNAFGAWENAGAALLSLTRTDGDIGAITVTCVIRPGTATRGNDYVSDHAVVTFAPGQTQQTLVVPLLDDDVAEGDEAFTVELFSLDAPARFGAVTNATVTLFEDDARVQFAAAEFAAGEADGAVTLTVTRAGRAAGAVTAAFAALPGTAVAGTDFTATNGILSWADGELGPKSVSVALANDSGTNGDVTFFVSLTNATGGAVIGPRSSARVTIFDDESPATAEFEAAAYSVGESDGQVTLVVRRSGGSTGIPPLRTVAFATSNLTALAGSDYVAGLGALSFSGAVLTQSVTVAVLDDFVVEGDKTFVVQLRTPNGLAPGARSNAVVTIRDAAPSFVDLHGHGLLIESNQNVVRTNFNTVFTNLLTIRNPAATLSATGVVVLTGLDAGSGFFTTDRWPLPAIPPGGFATVLVGGQGTYQFGATNTVLATVFEATATNLVAQDSRPVFVVYGTSPPSGGPPPPGSGLMAPGFTPPPVLTHLAIAGPALVDEGAAADFTATAQFSNGASEPVNADWRSSGFFISSAGRFEAAAVPADTTVLLMATAAVNGPPRTATGSVTVVNLAPLSLRALSRSNGQFRLQLNGTTGRRYVLEAVTNLSQSSNWSAVATNLVPTNGSLSVLDTGASNAPLRFYRARQTP